MQVVHDRILPVLLCISRTLRRAFDGLWWGHRLGRRTWKPCVVVVVVSARVNGCVY